MRVLSNLRRHRRLVVFILVFIFALYSTFLYLTVAQRGYDKVLSSLAAQFIKGHIALPIYNLPIRDIANYYNNYYLQLGPLASILLIPGAFFMGDNFPQVTIGVASMIVSFIAIYFISKKFKFNRLDSLWLALFFVFSTVLFSSSVINITPYQVEALGAPLILLAIWTYLYKKNPLLIGIFIGLASMTRITLMLTIIFFFIEMLRKKLSLKHFVLILLPLIIALSLLGLYNQRRFHSFFETGYSYISSKNEAPIGENIKFGERSITHIPTHLYSLLIMAPEPLLDKNGGFVLKYPYLKLNPWGVAIWFTSPLFLFLLTRFRKGEYTISAGLTILVISIPVFTWYSIGYAQVGYRYALDFLPLLFLILVPSLLPKLTKTAILLIITGVIFNCFYSISIWEMYPLLNILH